MAKQVFKLIGGCGFGKGFPQGLPFLTPPLLRGDNIYSVNACLAFKGLTQALLTFI